MRKEEWSGGKERLGELDENLELKEKETGMSRATKELLGYNTKAA